MKNFFNWDISLSMSKEERKIQGISQTLNKLYKCRDLEISNLWQRSVFLAVFLTLTISAYGFFCSNFIEDFSALWEKKSLSNIVVIVLSIIGMTFSIIWIMMGKASKAWYEVYENAITLYEQEYWRELGLPANEKDNGTEFRMGEMHSGEIENNLFSTKAGGYSPSKLNIIIGQVFLIIWIVVYLVHFTMFIYSLLGCENSCLRIFVSILTSSSVCVFFNLIKKLLNKNGLSSFLNKNL